MKKTLLILGLLFAILFTGCAKTPEKKSYSLRNDTFEESLELFCTDIFVATFTGKTKLQPIGNGCRFMYCFEIEEQWKGIETDGTIEIAVGYGLYSTDEGSFESDALMFEKGKSYVLPVDRYRSVFVGRDIFELCNMAIIPKEDISAAVSHGGLVPMSQNSETEFWTQAHTLEELKEYLLDCSKEHTDPFSGTDFVQSNKMEDIVKGSAEIVKVTVTEKGEVAPGADDREAYFVTIDKVYKGDTYTIGETVELIVFPGDLKIGKTYIVGLFGRMISSEKSVWNVSKEDKILGYINE